jgi:flagellar basal-body rod modification protein FlgD
MSTIDPTALDKFQLPTSEESNFNKELGQEEFFELMMAQLQNQDPMKPMDNGEFLGQMAQFSTVTGIEGMQESLQALTDTYATSQTLQATQLVGQEVLIEDNAVELSDDGQVSGSFELDASSGDVKLDIANTAGVVIQQIDLGSFAAGRHVFAWNGQNSDGERMPAGKYSVNVTAQRDDSYESLTTLTTRVIDSVEFGAGNQTTLNTEQGDTITMSDIRQIRSVNTVRDTPQ